VGAPARAIHNSAIVVDTHEDTPQRFLDENYDISSTDPQDTDFISLNKARAGNLGAVFFSIWVYPARNQGHFAKRTLELIDSVYRQASTHPDQMMMSLSVEDIERAHEQHKLAALMGIEGGHSIENNLSLLRDYYRLGVRYMTLTWSNTNDWADSSGDIRNPAITHHDGLTDFGKQVVLVVVEIAVVGIDEESVLGSFRQGGAEGGAAAVVAGDQGAGLALHAHLQTVGNGRVERALEAIAQVESEGPGRHRYAGQRPRGGAGGKPAPEKLLPVFTRSPLLHPYPQ